MLGRADAKTSASERAIAQTMAADQDKYDKALKEYEGQLEEWKALQRIAAGVVASELAAFKEAFEELNPFREIKELGQGAIQLQPGAKEHVPREIKSLLKSGAVSTKPESDTVINQTYQTHVYSCVLRVARELFAVLPFQLVFVHGLTALLNPQTGQKETRAIISALIPRSTVQTLNFESLDPVDCMRNFVHEMAFSKSRGFSSITPIDPKQHERKRSTGST
jgi:hypothetical protein